LAWRRGGWRWWGGWAAPPRRGDWLHRRTVLWAVCHAHF
jgi:hypothetical protein